LRIRKRLLEERIARRHDDLDEPGSEPSHFFVFRVLIFVTFPSLAAIWAQISLADTAIVSKAALQGHSAAVGVRKRKARAYDFEASI
jgi:hypothetical protein